MSACDHLDPAFLLILDELLRAARAGGADGPAEMTEWLIERRYAVPGDQAGAIRITEAGEGRAIFSLGGPA